MVLDPAATGLEIGLIIATLVLGLMVAGLSLAVFKVSRKNKTLKTAF